MLKVNYENNTLNSNDHIKKVIDIINTNIYDDEIIENINNVINNNNYANGVRFYYSIKQKEFVGKPELGETFLRFIIHPNNDNEIKLSDFKKELEISIEKYMAKLLSLKEESLYTEMINGSVLFLDVTEEYVIKYLLRKLISRKESSVVPILLNLYKEYFNGDINIIIEKADYDINLSILNLKNLNINKQIKNKVLLRYEEKFEMFIAGQTVLERDINDYLYFLINNDVSNYNLDKTLSFYDNKNIYLSNDITVNLKLLQMIAHSRNSKLKIYSNMMRYDNLNYQNIDEFYFFELNDKFDYKLIKQSGLRFQFNLKSNEFFSKFFISKKLKEELTSYMELSKKFLNSYDYNEMFGSVNDLKFINTFDDTLNFNNSESFTIIRINND